MEIDRSIDLQSDAMSSGTYLFRKLMDDQVTRHNN